MRRRVFVELGEVPGLLSGALRGEATSLRRLIGARRSGRIGIALAVSATLIAAPPAALIRLLPFYALLAIGLRFVVPAFGWREQQRVLLWIAAPLLLIAALLRLADVGDVWPAALAVLAAHRLTWTRLEALAAEAR